jgi:hypothetical protein
MAEVEERIMNSVPDEEPLDKVTRILAALERRGVR